MTRVEAIDLLDNLKGMIEDSQGNDYDEALKVAISDMENWQKIRADVIDECIEKLYEVTPLTFDKKLDMVFVDALIELKERKNVRK